MAKLADAADLKSADLYRSWGFKSPSGHQSAGRARQRSKGFPRSGSWPMPHRLPSLGCAQISGAPLSIVHSTANVIDTLTPPLEAR